MIPTLASLIIGALGGVAVWLGFPGPAGGWWPLVYLGLVVLLTLVRGRGGGQAFLSAFAWSCGFFLPHISWAREAAGSVAPWLALAGVQILAVSLWGWTVGVAAHHRWIRAHPWAWIVEAEVSFAGVEQIRAHYPYGGMPWGIVAYSQVDAPIGRLAPWIGEVGLTALVVAACAGVATALGAWTHLPARIGTAALAVCLCAVPLVATAPTRPQAGDLRVAAVQGNVDRPVRETYGNGSVLANHVYQTLQSIRPGDADVILWGEHAADRDPLVNSSAGTALAEVTDSLDIPLLYGTVRYGSHAGREARWGEYRLAGQPEATYAKRYPVPFGEFLPDRDFYLRISPDASKIGTDMVAGHKVGVIDVPLADRTVKMGVGICFEVAVEQAISDDVNAGAQIIVIPTNNALFGETSESVQQLQMARLRALEYQRSVVQVSTQGVSGIVLPNGKLIARTTLFTPDTLKATVPLRTSITPAARFGTAANTLTMGVTLFWAVACWVTAPFRARRRAATHKED